MGRISEEYMGTTPDTLQEKLRDIQLNPIEKYEEGDYYLSDTDIAQIQAAFQEAGWIDTKKPITGDIHGVGVYEVKRHESEDWDRLSGGEFYDRFKAELDNSKWMKTGGDLLYGDVLEAARLAAGVSDE